jgi:hypothetical protein
MRDRRALVDALDGAEAKRLLATLLDARPELAAEVAGLADAQLGAVTTEEVEEDVAFELECLSVEDVWERSGTQPDGSYVEPTEAAWEVVREAVAPFLADLTRRLELGRRAEATAVCRGVLLALYRVSQGEGEFLDGNAPDTLEEAAVGAVEAWKKGGRSGAGLGAAAREFAALRRFVSDALPEWESFLGRTIGRTPKKGTR